jgi:hypothetical protein
VVTDVSALPTGRVFKGQAVQDWIPHERRPHLRKIFVLGVFLWASYDYVSEGYRLPVFVVEMQRVYVIYRMSFWVRSQNCEERLLSS